MKRSLEELKEFGLIEEIKKTVEIYNPETIQGIGDDAAVIDTGNYYSLLSTDMFLEGVHFDLSYTPIKHLGYKSIVAGVSDIAAMNGIPKQVTVSIGLSNRFGIEAIDELYSGINAACKNYKVDLVGGDTSASMSGLVISVSVMGIVAKENVSYRNNAKENDIVCVTGDLGGAFIGLQLLQREKQVFKSAPEAQPKLEGFDYVIGRQLKPEARTDIIHDFLEKGLVPSSMIDISDGLASEIMHISTQSNVGISVFVENLPIANETALAANELNISPITAVMNGGEDFELLMTFKQDDFELIKSIPDITPIGFVNKDKTNKLVLKSGETTPIVSQGWTYLDNK